MNDIFSFDNKFILFINKIIYASWLNILWLLCSLPILTIGASSTALYTVSIKVVRGEEGNITRQFFAAFRDNLNPAV